MTAFIKKDKFFYVLLLIIGVLFIMNLISVFVFAQIDRVPYRTLRPIFDFDVEGNMPSLFSTILWLIASSLLYLISRVDVQRYNLHWLLLSVVFFYLGVDDGVGLHEKLSKPVGEMLNTAGSGGSLTFAWIIPYGAAVLLLGALYLRFFNQLPRNTMKQFVIAGFVFLSGAIGLEMLSGPYYSLVGEQSAVFKLFYSFEELLELTGMAIFIRALINYLTAHQRSLSIQFK